MVSSQASESFRALLLRHRGRSGLTQRQLAERVGIHRRSVQEWEIGVTYPSADRLETLIRVLMEARGLTPGHEAAEAQALWAAVEREAPRTRAPFDHAWFAQLLAQSAASDGSPATTYAAAASVPIRSVGEQLALEYRQDWGDAPDTTAFVGRTEELAMLGRCVLNEGYRVLAILGMGGIGKTSLAARLAQDVAHGFERVYWRSLRDVPPPSDWLAGAIGFLSDQQLVTPAAESERLAALLQLLRARRCLLVLDNFETLSEAGQSEGRYRPGLAGYGRLLQVVGEAAHQSCLALTSRVAPPQLAVLGGGAVRIFEVGGLGVHDAQVLLAPKQLAGTGEQWAELTARFGGNGLALKVVGETIRELFAGDIGQFLNETGTSSMFGGIRRLLAEQVDHCSDAEQQVLRLLAIEREPMSITGLLDALGPSVGRAAVLEAVQTLRRHSLVERAKAPGTAAFTLQSVVLEYVTDRLVETVASEIQGGEPVVLKQQPLIKAQAKDYVRHTQERLVGDAILHRLQVHAAAETRLLGLLEGWRGRPLGEQGYGPGNVVNLLRLLRGDLRALDLSHLALRDVYLAQVDAQHASLVSAHLARAVLADVFGLPLSVAMASDGGLLVAGTSAGEVWLWRVADHTPLWAIRAHTSGVWSLALSAHGHLLASGGEDGLVRLWETSTARPVRTLQGHTATVRGVALSAEGRLLASGSFDGTVRLWDTDTGRAVATLQGNTSGVRGLALSADGRLLASGGEDGTVRLWDTDTARAVATLQGHTSGVWAVALSADGRLLASGSFDGTVRLWETDSGGAVATLHGHTAAVRGVALSADGHLLASGSFDGTVRLWKTDSGGAVATLHGHTAAVRGVALSADGHLLASGSFDGTVRLWETSTARPLATLQGDTGMVSAIALSRDGRLLASGGEDRTVRLWDTASEHAVVTLQGHTAAVSGVALSAEGRLLASCSFDGTVRLAETDTGRVVATFQGHTGAVRGMALSEDGRLLASGSLDGTVRLWNSENGRAMATLQGHTSGVWSVALSADKRLLASGGEDDMVRVWETSTRLPVATLQGHTGGVWTLALSEDGHLLASGGGDATVRLWDTSTGRLLATLPGHDATVRGVTLFAEGRLLASGSVDGTVRLWDTSTGRPLTTLQGHTGGVSGVALSRDGHLLASGGFDGTVRLWEVSSGTCLCVLRPERRYERLDITDLQGITDAQHSALLALGAIERQVPAGAPTARVPLGSMR